MQQAGIAIHLLNLLMETELLLWNRKDGVQLGMYFSIQSGFQEVSVFLRMELDKISF